MSFSGPETGRLSKLPLLHLGQDGVDREPAQVESEASDDQDLMERLRDVRWTARSGVGAGGQGLGSRRLAQICTSPGHRQVHTALL